MPNRLMDAFVKDGAYPADEAAAERHNLIADPIAGCSAVSLAVHSDKRGQLIELGTIRDEPVWSFVHIYQVFAEPGSLRGWVYHARQYDRLAFTNGRFKVVLHDLREDSPTFRKTNVLIVGGENKVLVTTAPFVAHCVENLDSRAGSFVNMPTRPYYLDDPDKFRLNVSSGIIPYPDEPR